MRDRPRRRSNQYNSRVCTEHVDQWRSGYGAGFAISRSGSNPSRPAVECNSGQVVYTHVRLLPSSRIWYQPMGGDALRLGR